MLTIFWKSRRTGATGHGNPIPANAAKQLAAKLNRDWPDLDHWTA